MTYSNANVTRKTLLDFSLIPLMTSISTRLSMPDFVPSTQSVHFKLEDYLRGSEAERVGIYKTLFEIGTISVEEIRQAEQNRNLTTGQMSVDSMLQDYGYDISKAGINYSRAQDAQSLADYQRMIASQGAANIQSAESAYLTGLMNQYAQNAANQSQLASGASAGINNAASNIRGTTYVDQPGSSGFNWSALGNLGKAGVGLFSSLSGMFGGGGSATSNAAVTQSYPEMSIPYSGRKDDYTYMPFPYSGSK